MNILVILEYPIIIQMVSCQMLHYNAKNQSLNYNLVLSISKNINMVQIINTLAYMFCEVILALCIFAKGDFDYPKKCKMEGFHGYSKSQWRYIKQFEWCQIFIWSLWWEVVVGGSRIMKTWEHLRLADGVK